MNEMAANALNIKQGDTLSLFYNTEQVNVTAQVIVQNQNIGAMGGDVSNIS